MSEAKTILLVEDNDDDAFLMRRALKEAGITNPLVRLEDGRQAIEYLSGTGEFSDREKHPRPAIVFLDLKLPFKSGHEVLAWMRDEMELAGVVKVVLTSSNEPKDIKQSYALGANSYLVKPPTGESLLELTKAFKWYWLEWNVTPAVSGP